MHVRGMCRLALVALARLESGQAKLKKPNKGCDTHPEKYLAGHSSQIGGNDDLHDF